MKRIDPPTAEDYALAKQVAEWMESLAETEQTSDYLYNLGIYGKAGVVNGRGFGIVASAVQAFNRELAKGQERKDFSSSRHVGQVGERVTVKVKLLSVYDSANDFGVTYIQKFIDDQGNLFTWFGSTCIRVPSATGERRAEPGDEFWLKGTVKRHGEHKGVKETILSRAAYVDDPETAKAKKAADAKAKREAKKAQAGGTE